MILIVWDTVSNALSRSKHGEFMAFPSLASSVDLSQANLEPCSRGFWSRKGSSPPSWLCSRSLFLSFQYSFIQQHVAGPASLTLCNQWLHSCCRQESVWAFQASPPAVSWGCPPWTCTLQTASPGQLCAGGGEARGQGGLWPASCRVRGFASSATQADCLRACVCFLIRKMEAMVVPAS